jgi:carbamoyl-phosphate synthase large subunit
MNILLTCAGRRSYLVEYFKEALAGSGKVHAANSISDAPAMLAADHTFVTKSIYAKDYITDLIGYCKNNQIEMIVSLLDLELNILAKHKDDFKKNNIFLAISEEEVCQTCNDKWKTQAFLNVNDFLTVPMFLEVESALKSVSEGESSFPFFVKPRWGMGSIAIFKAENEEELKVFFKKTKRDLHQSYLHEGSQVFGEDDVIIQQALPGEEYGLDVVNDFNTDYQTTFVKKKLAMRSGETDIAITLKNEILEKLGEKLSKSLKHTGNLDVDVFFDGKTPYILELNPRFGGGYPFTHLAGGNVVMAYIDWIRGENFNFDFKADIKGLKSIVIKRTND